MSERYTTTRIPHARPLGGPSVMEGLYTGAELTTRSARPGAYDALALPSLVSGRLVSREQLRQELLAPLPPAPPMPMSRSAGRVADPDALPLRAPSASPAPGPVEHVLPPSGPWISTHVPVAIFDQEHAIAQPLVIREASASTRSQSPAPVPARRPDEYRPRDGSGPYQVLRHLQQHGGHLLYSEICKRFDIPSHSLTAIFNPALTRGALIRLHVGDRRALALPGYTPPDQVHSARPADAPYAVQPNPRIGDPLAIPAADLGRALEDAARLLMRVAALLPSFNH